MSPFSKIHFSSKSDDWATPKELYDKLNSEFSFNFDPCPLHHNIDEWNGLEIDWKERNFINPPYSRQGNQTAWVQKALDESKKGKLCVLLIPVRTSSKRWQDLIFPYASDIRYLRGRLKFGGHNNSAPFCSAVVVFDGR